ncbi:MarR family winged helix-turn-helix transcriptional regulator [Lichenifustis flavocetrariae]|uniref:MarR family transcriptional regulator n=1 Tax=Lichenifustis flavocetrariae TaxID=2949735 RepID=A0AA42CL30_9HYPH|nr:MarR family transcriptional regulator [Lichenifustis flavocetrariae]MCW6511194.1 MarR family transcriptional regulator [Lichenifustis flavocetrariae]
MEQDRLTFEGTWMVAEKCLCTNVQRAARSIGRRFDEAFRPLDLTNWQFTLLVALNRPEPPTINVLAKDLAIDRTTITGSLKPLERRGLVSIKQDATDKRARRVELTEAGSELLQQAYAIWKQVEGAVERDLAIDDIDGFRAGLRAATAV